MLRKCLFFFSMQTDIRLHLPFQVILLMWHHIPHTQHWPVKSYWTVTNYHIFLIKNEINIWISKWLSHPTIGLESHITVTKLWSLTLYLERNDQKWISPFTINTFSGRKMRRSKKHQFRGVKVKGLKRVGCHQNQKIQDCILVMNDHSLNSETFALRTL